MPSSGEREELARVLAEWINSGVILHTDDLAKQLLEFGYRRAAGWRPISEAPRDGVFLIANKLRQVCSCESMGGQRIVHNMPGFSEWTWGNDVIYWQPLPLPPEEM